MNIYLLSNHGFPATADKQLPYELCAIIVNLACSVNPCMRSEGCSTWSVCVCVRVCVCLSVCLSTVSRAITCETRNASNFSMIWCSFARKLEHYLLTWIGRLFCRTCTRPYMIFHYTYVHVIVGRAYYYQVRSRLFLCIVNNCAKGLHFSAFIILWFIHVHVHVCIYTHVTCTEY